MRRDRERLQDMLQAIEKIERYAVKGFDALKNDELLQTWIVHHIEIIGEAARGVSEELRKDYPEVRWRELGLLRNELIHEYFSVDIEEVWKVVERDIPDFKHQIIAILKELQEGAH